MVIYCQRNSYKLKVAGKVLNYATKEERDADRDFYQSHGLTVEYVRK